MPVKFNNSGPDPLMNQSPIVEKIKDHETNNSISDMMSDIIEEQVKIKNTSIIDMAGVLTPVLYYQKVSDKANNYAIDANGPNDISLNGARFNVIKDFKVKLNGATTLNNDTDDQDKSYISEGSLTILPRSIQPNEGDIFIMKYYGKELAYFISAVNTETFEDGCGFKCEYTLYKEKFTLNPHQIVNTYRFIQEFVSTTYRCVLRDEDYENVKHFETLYTHLSSVYNSLFYNKDINGYIYRNYDEENEQINTKDNNNINTLGLHGGLYRGNIDGHKINSNDPIKVDYSNEAYDNYLNNFMKLNRIFRNYDGLLLSVEPMLNVDRVGYKRSVFGCVESRSVSNYKNTFVSAINVDRFKPGISSYFVGKKNIIHSNESMKNNNKFDVEPSFPTKLINQLNNGKGLDMSISVNDTVYDTLDSMIIETIMRYVYKQTDDFIDRFKYLYDNIDNLYDHVISYENIFYLFPLLGFVIERSLEEIYRA